MSEGTWIGIGQPDFGGLLRIVADSVTFEVGALRVRPFTVPHDAREPLQLTCTDGDATLGVLTDLGHATPHVISQLTGTTTLLLECNHDPEMLENGSYPWPLKRRVGGDWGHLANADAAAIAQAVQPHGLRRVVAAHLSEQNNRPELARAALQDTLGGAIEVHVADGPKGCGWLHA
jgi:phosphoribosyl 1,2-cyclic phosphodiesterase